MIVAELQYFPPLIFFPALYSESYVYIDIYEDYRKMSFRNRCLLAGAQGIISLSVPLLHGRNQHLPMKEVMISGAENWQARHLRSIQSAYNRSPFFEFYHDEIADLFQKSFDWLADWNIHCLNWLRKKMEWPAEILYTESAVPFRSEGIDDRRNLVMPKNYVNWNPAKYRQVFEERTGFFPNLSILDLLFNTGPRAGELLRNSSNLS
jgi:WbqC-like protein family